MLEPTLVKKLIESKYEIELKREHHNYVRTHSPMNGMLPVDSKKQPA